jgi:CRP-like cAMP-binding protein
VHQSFKAGDVIIRQGSYETSAYIIESGKVEISITVNDKKTVFAIMGEKQIFGEMGLMDDRPRSATVTALEVGMMFLSTMIYSLKIILRSLHLISLQIIS